MPLGGGGHNLCFFFGQVVATPHLKLYLLSSTQITLNVSLIITAKISEAMMLSASVNWLPCLPKCLMRPGRMLIRFECRLRAPLPRQNKDLMSSGRTADTIERLDEHT